LLLLPSGLSLCCSLCLNEIMTKAVQGGTDGQGAQQHESRGGNQHQPTQQQKEKYSKTLAHNAREGQRLQRHIIKVKYFGYAHLYVALGFVWWKVNQIRWWENMPGALALPCSPATVLPS
jgi:hypothetical protein